MKKLFSLMLVLTFLVSFDAFAQTGQDWKWMHQTPQGNTLRWVKAWSQTTWYAVGYAGTFMKTTNAGTTWDFNHLAGGPFGYSGQRTNAYDAYFFNMNTGYIAGSSGYIIKTTNAGVSFDTVYYGAAGSVYGISFANANTGYAVTNTTTARVIKTTNAGVSWTMLTTPPWTSTSYQLYVMDTSKVYVCNSTGGIYITTDGGTTWTAQTTGLTTALYRIMFSDANNGYATGASGKFIYTTNGGTTWTAPTNTGLPAGGTFYDLELKPLVIPQKLNEGFENATFPPTGWITKNILGAVTWGRSTTYFNTGTASAFVTYNSTGGEEWLVSPKINAVAATDTLSFFLRKAFTSAFPPDSLIIAVSTTDTNNASCTNIIARIDVANLTASTWVPFSIGLSAYAGQNIYVAFQHKDTDGNGVYLDDVTIGKASTSNTITVTGTANAVGSYLVNVFKTANLGTSWDTLGTTSTVAAQPWTSTYYSADYIGTSDTLLTVGAFGLINKRNTAANRICFTTLLFANTLYDVWAQSISGNVIAVGASSSAGAVFDQIIRSTNGGTNWNIVSWTTAATSVLNSISMVDANTGWVVGSNSTVLRTSNGGVSWDSLPAAITGMAPTLNLCKVQFLNANTGFIFSKTFNSTTGDTTTIFKTSNAGLNWTKLRLTGAVGTANQIYGAFMLDANTGWCINYVPVPYKTTDGGLTWTAQTLVDSWIGGYLYDIKMVNANTGYISGGGGKIYKTTNSGALWDTISKPTNASYSFYTLEVLNATTLLVAGSTGTTLYSSNSGTTWGIYNTSGSTVYGTYQFNDGKAFAVGSSGFMWKNTNIITGTGSNVSEIPGTYELAQNYPNPFNPTTTIKFAIPKAGIVTLKVYDITGKEVTRIINNQFYSAGWSNVTFNASNLSSGVYFYQMIVDNNVINAKKMVLIK